VHHHVAPLPSVDSSAVSVPEPPVEPPQPWRRTARAGDRRPRGRADRPPWRAVGTVLTSIGTPVGIGVADPLLGQVAAAVELAVVLTIIGTALFGSQALSDRAFRLLRWIANRPEPPGPASSPAGP
jgi:hypothetical protein